MKMGRRKIGIGFVLTLFSAFLLAQPGWAFVADPLLGGQDGIPQGYPDQTYNPNRYNEPLNTPEPNAKTPGDRQEADGQEITHYEATSDQTKRTEMTLRFKTAIIANQLVVIGQTTITKVWDFLTGDYTESISQIFTRYDRNANPIWQRGIATSATERQDGGTETSSTRIFFERNLGAGGFVAVLQDTTTVIFDPGSLLEDRYEDRYQLDENGDLVLDENGDPIVEEENVLFDTAESDDTRTTQRSIITREYDEIGRLINVTGEISGDTNGLGQRTHFDGTMEFDICQNTECLVKQTTVSWTTDHIRGGTTETTSVFEQDVDARGKVLSARANSTSVTWEGDNETTATSTTDFVVTRFNTVAAVKTVTESESWDRANGRYTRSTQTVDIVVDRETGRVHSASGAIESQTVNVLEDGTPADPNNPDEIGYIANTTGTMTFDVINNSIVNTRMETTTTVNNIADNITSQQTQVIENNYDPVTGRGTTGKITTTALTTTTGELDFDDRDGDGERTRFDPVSGQWIIDVDDNSDVTSAVYTASHTEIATVFRGGQFLAEWIASSNVSYNDLNGDITTNVILTRQTYHADGRIAGNEFGSDIYPYETEVIHFDEGDYGEYGIDSSGMDADEILRSLHQTATRILGFYFDDDNRPRGNPYNSRRP